MIHEKDFNDIVLHDWNATTRSYSRDKSIHYLFLESLAKYPSQTAVSTGNNLYSYQQINQKVELLAANLEKHGLTKNQFVGVYLDRSVETVVTLLAILKLNCAYVPLNKTDPQERITTITHQIKLAGIITSSKYKQVFEESCVLYFIDEDSTSGMFRRIENEDTNLPSGNAYVIFTSGTTGIPKGVLVKQPAVVNLIEWVNKTFAVNEKDSLLWVTNLSFDLSVYDIFGILAAGGTIRILTDEEQQDPKIQAKILFNEKITFWDSAPQALQRLLPFLEDAAPVDEPVALRLIFASGDWIPLKLPESLREHFPNAEFVALGGATEATIWSNYYRVHKVDPAWKSIPYGKPIQNSRYYILDDNLEHCLPGTEGNLYIGGDCLAAGYFGDDKLTASKFVDDPFVPGQKMYATGDKARWMEDGNIEFLGRDDEQVKIRGNRVELEEIRYRARKIEGIEDIFLYADKTDIQNPVLVMAFTCDTKCLDAEQFRALLAERLPECMVPSKLIRLDKFPLMLNGKIDKNRIEQIAKKIESSAGAGNEQSLIEKQLLQLWQDELKVEKLCAHDKFLDLGGHSLIAYALIAKIEKQFKVKVAFRDFFGDFNTVNKLASHIEEKSESW